MRSFKHFNPSSLSAAVSTLDDYKEKAKVIAGGTDLLGTLKDNIHAAHPDALVNIKTLEDLSYVQEDGKGLRLGALTKLHEIETNQIIRDKYRILAEASHTVATPQVRNMATIGGNICQEPRCWYYRNYENTFHCLRKGGKVCNALTGENRYQSIFGAARVETTPCTSSCPDSIDIPSYLSLIREGDLAGAAKILLEANPLAAVTGRVCPHYCEDECNRGEFDEAVSIKDVERFLGDYILENAGNLIKPPAAQTGKNVAVIGSGPAGLTAAHYLRMAGHKATVFDRMKEAGGMLTYAIPAYRLPKDVIKRFVKAMEKVGVEFNLGVEVGKDVTLDAIKKKHDCIFLATGAWDQPSIGLDGEALTKSGLELLTNTNLGVKEVPGRRVVVIGGGNVAVDVGITVKRLGAERVTLACLECQEEMPAFEWEVAEAVEEGIELMPSWGPYRVLETKGKVRGIELVRCTSVFDSEGNFNPTFDSAVKEKLEADQVIMAVGQRADLSYLDPEWSLKVDRGVIAVDPESQVTDMSTVFAGGDVTSGPATVVEAISTGRRAAVAINRYLGGTRAEAEDTPEESVRTFLEFNRDYLKKTSRVRMPQLAPSGRKIDAEDFLGIGRSEVETEANRCFNCGCVAVSASDIAPVLVALSANIKTTKRTVKAEDFFMVRPLSSTVLDHDELVAEIQIPVPRNGTKLAFLKFRIRNSIDFPIVSVATVLNMNSGKIDDARIVLGAVAPVPLRVREAEGFLKGKEPSEDVAENVAGLAVKGAIPLAENHYKVQIAEALVRRAILSAC